MALTLWLFATLFFVPKDTLTEAFITRCPPSPDCSSGECPPPPDCPHGVTTDRCGKPVCFKGPGEICGRGLYKHVFGSCGDGMFCNCGRCTGCSMKSLECYYKTCVRKDN